MATIKKAKKGDWIGPVAAGLGGLGLGYVLGNMRGKAKQKKMTDQSEKITAKKGNMIKIKKAQTGVPIKKKKAVVDSVESEMFPGRKIPRSQSNYENDNFVKMLEGNKPKPKVKVKPSAPKKKLKVGGKLTKAKGGKEMITRADGTKSRRGLWDNIRAAAKRNKAAGRPGKKPTAAMLKQERKIKAKGK